MNNPPRSDPNRFNNPRQVNYFFEADYWKSVGLNRPALPPQRAIEPEPVPDTQPDTNAAPTPSYAKFGRSLMPDQPVPGDKEQLLIKLWERLCNARTAKEYVDLAKLYVELNGWKDSRK